MPTDARERVLLAIALLVSAVWAVAQLVQIVSPSHSAPDSVNTVMVYVAAAFFGGSVISSALSGRQQRREEADAKGKADDG